MINNAPIAVYTLIHIHCLWNISLFIGLPHFIFHLTPHYCIEPRSNKTFCKTLADDSDESLESRNNKSTINQSILWRHSMLTTQFNPNELNLNYEEPTQPATCIGQSHNFIVSMDYFLLKSWQSHAMYMGSSGSLVRRGRSALAEKSADPETQLKAFRACTRSSCEATLRAICSLLSRHFWPSLIQQSNAPMGLPWPCAFTL